MLMKQLSHPMIRYVSIGIDIGIALLLRASRDPVIWRGSRSARAFARLHGSHVKGHTGARHMSY